MLLQSERSLLQSTENIYYMFIHIFCITARLAFECSGIQNKAFKEHKIHHNSSTTTRYLLRWHSQNIQATIKEFCRPFKLGARSIQPKFPEISVQNSMDRFGPTGKVSKKRLHLLRWSSFPGRTGWNFG